MTLKLGDKGPKVKELQKALGIYIDGDFGPKTEQAVKHFQKENNLVIDGVFGKNSWSKIKQKWSPYTSDQIKKAVLDKEFFWSPFSIVGIRNSETDNKVTNHYDDHITLTTPNEFYCWDATTDPGLHWIKNPLNKDGCAILAPGQYANVYKIDKHQGKYDALCQRGGKVTVFRDGNKDDIYDHKNDQSGYFGINIHRSSLYNSNSNINKWSAGCQVFQDADDFDLFMKICKESKQEWFTYTLIESKDIE